MRWDAYKFAYHRLLEGLVEWRRHLNLITFSQGSCLCVKWKSESHKNHKIWDGEEKRESGIFWCSMMANGLFIGYFLRFPGFSSTFIILYPFLKHLGEIINQLNWIPRYEYNFQMANSQLRISFFQNYRELTQSE